MLALVLLEYILEIWQMENENDAWKKKGISFQAWLFGVCWLKQSICQWPCGKLTEQWNVTISNRTYIFNGLWVHFPLLCQLTRESSPFLGSKLDEDPSHNIPLEHQPKPQKSPASVQSVVPRGTRGRHEPAGEGPSLRVNCCCWFRNSIELVDLNHTTLMIIGWWVTCTALVEKLPSSHRGVSWDFFNRNAVLRVRMHSEVQNQPFLIHSGILNNGFIPGNSLWPFWQTETWLIVADQSPEKGWWCLCFFH